MPTIWILFAHYSCGFQDIYPCQWVEVIFCRSSTSMVGNCVSLHLMMSTFFVAAILYYAEQLKWKHVINNKPFPLLDKNNTSYEYQTLCNDFVFFGCITITV